MTTEDLKKELGDLIWKMATNLVHGGKVSSVQFMDYTLGALFYRFISENITDYCNLKMREAGVEDADYRLMSDDDAEVAREQIVQAKGFFILPSQLFGNVADRARHNDELNTTLANNTSPARATTTSSTPHWPITSRPSSKAPSARPARTT